MIINEPFMHTKLQIWQPKYSSQYDEGGEWVVKLSRKKVDHATPIILIEFTKAKHLIGQRFAIHRSTAQKYKSTPMKTKSGATVFNYDVPMSALNHWETQKELDELAGL